MRKLTVKNFSVIKDAELEFGKITVLIGPQSSGKSLLCKLAYFLSKELLDIAVGRALNDFDFQTFEKDANKKFMEWFPPTGWGHNDWTVSFVSDEYEVTASFSAVSFDQSPIPSLEFGDKFRLEYKKQLSNARPWKRGLIYGALSKLMGRAWWEGATYIPSERSYFVDTQKGYRLVASQADPIASRFAEFYPETLNPDIANLQLIAHLQGELIRGGESWLFSFKDGRILPLNLLSTGSKELFPLLCGLEMYSHRRREITLDEQYNQDSEDHARFDDFFIEEPEAHIFPEKQYEIVQYFAAIVNDQNLKPALTITTHSPYILSVFGNLIKAGKVGAQSAEHHAAVAEIIPEKYWIKDGDFAAYKIEDRKLVTIFDRQTGEIDGDYLDDVSGKIAEEFSNLLEIQYGQ